MHDPLQTPTDRQRLARRPELVAAVIRPGPVAPANFPYEAVRVTDPVLLNRLAGFFDAYWSGEPSGVGIGAVEEFVVEFTDAAGGRHALLLTPGRKWCMTHRGDRPMHPAFDAFFQTLIA